MGISDRLVMSSAVDDERIGWAWNALDWLLVDLGDIRSGDDIRDLTADVRITGSTRKLSPGPARGQAEIGNERVNSSAESMNIVNGIVLLKDADGTNEVLLKCAQKVHDQCILTHNLAKKKSQFLLVQEYRRSDKLKDVREYELLLGIQTFILSSVDAGDLGRIKDMELNADTVDKVEELLTIIVAVGNQAIGVHLMDTGCQGSRNHERRRALKSLRLGQLLREPGVEVRHDER